MILEIYLGLLILGFTLALILMILGHHDWGIHIDHADMSHDAPNRDGPGLFSPMLISVFLGAFGGWGVIFTSWDREGPWINLMASLGGAILIHGVTYRLLRSLVGKTENSISDPEKIISGVMLDPILPGGMGRVSYFLNGASVTSPARANDPEGTYFQGAVVNFSLTNGSAIVTGLTLTNESAVEKLKEN